MTRVLELDGWRAVVRHEPVAAAACPERDRLLTPLERERRDRLVRPADRDASTAAHGLVRECAAVLLGRRAAELTLVQECARCGRAGHGAPSLVGHPHVAVSLSRTDGHVAAIAATRVVGEAGGQDAAAPRVGIDVERVREVPAAALSARERRWLAGRADRVAAATHLWVRKEALVKAGVLDLDRLAELDVLGDASTVGAGTRPVHVHGHALRGWTADGVVGAWALPLR